MSFRDGRSSSREVLAGAVLLATLLVAAPAEATECWRVTGWTNSGQVGGTAVLTPVSCQSTPSGYAWAQITMTYGSGTLYDLYLQISLSDSHVSGFKFQPLLIYSHRAANNVPVIVIDLIPCIPCTNEINLSSQPPPCRLSASWWNSTSLPAQEDGLGCLVTAAPAGSSPFIWNNAYYIASSPSTNCPMGGYDGANCYVMPAPQGSFIWNNSFYKTAGPNNTCSIGTFDGANCYIASAPWATSAFIYAGNFYTTTRPSCQTGSFDGANCYMGAPPAGRTASVMNGSFYYSK
jgi:hypothetical protein